MPNLTLRTPLGPIAHFFTAGNRLIKDFLPNGSETAWLGRFDDQVVVPQAIRQNLIQADRTVDGLIQDFDQIPNSHGTALLQAAVLLKNPYTSGLQKSVQGNFFVQSTRGGFLAFGKAFAELLNARQVAVSA